MNHAMILESRSIIFSDEELVLAFGSELEGRAQDPSSEPVAVQSVLDDEGEVRVSFKMSDNSQVVFQSGEVGPVVLNHCIEVGVPLPRGSYKELAIRGDHVALIVRLETGAGVGNDDDY